LRGTTEIASGYYRYHRAAKQLQESHTGSSERYLTAEEDQECARIIQAANAAQAGITALFETDPERALAERKRYAALIAAGTQAKHKLIETNLRFASYYARASMNIVPPKKSGKAPDVSAEAEEIASPSSRREWRPGAYSDITKLKSRFADLEDRTQVANEALVKAADTFTPKLDPKGKPVPFLSHAKYHIHNALSRHAKVHEMPGWYVGHSAMDELYEARRKPDAFTPEELETMQQRDDGRRTVSIDDVGLTVNAPEEAPDDDDAEAWLSLAELIADPNADATTEAEIAERDRLIEEMLEALGSREAGTLTLKNGLQERSEPWTSGQIAAVYGVTRERIRQIERKVLAKIRVSEARQLRAFLEVDMASVPERLPVVASAVAGILNLRTERLVAHTNEAAAAAEGQQAQPDQTPAPPRKPELASWQTYENEPWDMREEQENILLGFERTAQAFRALLYDAAPHCFSSSATEGLGIAYSPQLIRTINEQLGQSVTVSHIETFWNEQLLPYVSAMQAKAGEDFSLNHVVGTFSRLLAERLKDDDHVELQIPRELDGKLHGVGAWLRTGELTVHGNAGDYVGYRMGGVALIAVHGSAGDNTGAEASGYASLDISGNARNSVGRRASGSASIIVRGSAGDYCGQDLEGAEATIEVGGDVGEYAAKGARRGRIVVRGIGLSAVLRSDFRGTIEGEFVEHHIENMPLRPGTLATRHSITTSPEQSPQGRKD